MKQNNLLKAGFWLLLILNLVLLGQAWFMRPHAGFPPLPHDGLPPGGLKEEIIHSLHLDPAQRESFEKLASAHREEMMGIETAEQNLLVDYFSELAERHGDIDRAATMEQFLALEKKKVESTYTHFDSVKALLRPEQTAQFPKVLRKALDIILIKQKGPMRPKE